MCNIATLVAVFTYFAKLTLFKPQIFNSANLFWKKNSYFILEYRIFSEKSYFCNFKRSELETVRFYESNSVETVSSSTSIWNRFKIGSILRLFLANRETLFLFDRFKTSVSHSSAITLFN